MKKLKSQKSTFGKKVLDGAFRTMCERLVASNNPNLFLLNYDLKRLSVVSLFVVPKQFFVREIIEVRKPLAVTARRAGWIGCNILLNQIPANLHCEEWPAAAERARASTMEENALSTR